MGWRFVLSIINHLNKGIRKTLDIIEVDQNPTWKQCLYNMGFNNQQNGWLHGAIGSMYARRYFGKEQKTPIREMVRYLKESFRNIIKQTKWMSSDTRTKALKKLEAMKEIIAYPEELSNETIIDDFYRGKKTCLLGHKMVIFIVLTLNEKNIYLYILLYIAPFRATYTKTKSSF